MTDLLSDIRILDLTTVLSGPSCTNVLAHLGAEVIKVEAPGGDILRMVGEPRIDTLAPIFMQVNRGKKSIVLDLRAEAGKEALIALAADCDVLVENFRPGVMDRLGLGYERIAGINPEIIYASISGFGETGPWSDMRAYDLMIQALSGFMSVQGRYGDPEYVQCAIADKITGRAAAEGILAALVARGRGKGGTRLAVSMLDATIEFLMEDSMAQHTFIDRTESKDRLDHVKFEVADGWVSILFIQLEEYHSLFRALGRADLCDDRRFSTREALVGNFTEWQRETQALLRMWRSADLIERTRAVKLPVAPVLNQEQMFAFDQVAENGTFTVRDLGEKAGRVRYLNGPWRVDGAPLTSPADPPRLGEHSEELLRGIGWDDEAIASAVPPPFREASA